ncbi:hypothetical protein [Burkholderia plantarii]|uniref:hypothetical protein n=1 Tax=Burkholderia plantarii TaxID=41899 RepID=UPI0018DBF05A|nr:hypothetical protein [Burkholderia plantarii]MBI0328298.1 hypothetical protein [Burkholderia plantarii]
MNHFFVARRSAIAMVIAELNTLTADDAALSSGDQARVGACQRLLIALRAGRVDSFVLPAGTPIQVTVLD